MPTPGVAVIDFETTGLFPSAHRVAEVAVVHVSPDGVIEGAWDTLVNPQRDLGAQDIHRIRAADVLDAPSFADIAPQLVDLLDGRVIVAHNAAFDMRFLVAELERAGYAPTLSPKSLCTMQLARDFLSGAGRALKDCCDALDIVLEDAHRASVDAMATAQLLSAYMRMTDDSGSWYSIVSEALEVRWPAIAWPRREWYPREAAQSSREASAGGFLGRISVRLPDYSGPVECLDYLAMLDLCLLDRVISSHEARELVALADSLGIGRDTCRSLHLDYFSQVAAVAWSDGVLTTDEIADLALVAKLLSVPADVVSAALQQPAATEADPRPSTFSLSPGDLIVLTGEMLRPRSDWEAHIESRGFKTWSAVTKKVRLVAAADPDSLSGKAKKARDYGIVIVDEAGLERLLG